MLITDKIADYRLSNASKERTSNLSKSIRRIKSYLRLNALRLSVVYCVVLRAE